MKNNTMIIFGIILLISPIISLTARMQLAPVPVPHRITQGRVAGKVAKEPSDEEIMANHQFKSDLHEVTDSRLTPIKRAHRWNEISKYYSKWATVDRQGAASEFKPQVQD